MLTNRVLSNAQTLINLKHKSKSNLRFIVGDARDSQAKKNVGWFGTCHDRRTKVCFDQVGFTMCVNQVLVQEPSIYLYHDLTEEM